MGKWAVMNMQFNNLVAELRLLLKHYATHPIDVVNQQVAAGAFCGGGGGGWSLALWVWVCGCFRGCADGLLEGPSEPRGASRTPGGGGCVVFVAVVSGGSVPMESLYPAR